MEDELRIKKQEGQKALEAPEAFKKGIEKVEAPFKRR